MKKRLRILLVEDDHLQANDLEKTLEAEFGAEVQTFSTEHEFVRQFWTIAENPPDVAILDRMLRWASPSRDMLAPPEDARDPEQAGVRCAERMAEDERTRPVPVILYSVLGDDGDTHGIDCVVKEGVFENLIAWIKSLNLGRA